MDIVFFVLISHIFIITIFSYSHPFLNTGEKGIDCGARIRIRCVVTCMEEAAFQVGMGSIHFCHLFPALASTPFEPPFEKAALSLCAVVLGVSVHCFLQEPRHLNHPVPALRTVKESIPDSG